MPSLRNVCGWRYQSEQLQLALSVLFGTGEEEQVKNEWLLRDVPIPADSKAIY